MSRSLTRNPTLLTALLSVATLAGYVTYRLTVGGAGPVPVTADVDMAQFIGADEDHDEEHEHADALSHLDTMGLPDIGLNDLSGAATTLAAHGGKPLLINFWATWCAPCLREIPMLKEFHSADNGIEVIGIAVDRVDPVLEYADEMQFNYPVLIGPTGPAEGMNVMAEFENIAGAMPFSVFVAADGAVLGRHAGELHAEHLEAIDAIVTGLDARVIDLASARGQIAELFAP